jgi:AraC-like DNA-binding protein
VALARLAADYTLLKRTRRARRGLPDSVARILLDNSEPPAKAFERWSRRVFKVYTVRPDLAERAGKIIRSERSVGRLDLPAIARALDCPKEDLRVAFRRRYGMSPRRYHNTVRALHSIDVLLADPTKISEIAEDLGFKSAKDLYRLMEEVTGLTPRRLRALSPSQAEELRERLRKALRLPEVEG